MVSDTLVIKRLPEEFSAGDKIAFLRNLGAKDVKIIASKRNKYNIAFARFPSPIFAEKVLRNLHQEEVMGSYVSVEYAHGKPGISDELKPIQVKSRGESNTEAMFKKFMEKLNCWTVGTDFRAPVPSHLRYHYPPPTPCTLRNIIHLISTTPKLYTQVLHLMNKMNLPCPIGDELPGVRINTQYSFPGDKSGHIENLHPLTSSSEIESELSTDDGEGQHKETIPDLKPKIKKTLNRKKILKPPVAQPPAVKKKKRTFDEVFEDPKKLMAEPIKKKLKPLSELKDIEPQAYDKGFGFIYPVNKSTDDRIEEVDDDGDNDDGRNPMEEERLEKEEFNCITLKALAVNRISEKDRAVLPVFKNYAEGAPTCRLYIKNLAKQTTEDDLSFIYSRFRIQPQPEEANAFDIRLMQEGRMKGQAFVTLQSLELAQAALANTNGYIVNDKPMVVQFARVATK